MLNHEKVFKVAKNDEEFVAALKATDQRLPRMSFFADTLELGVWAASYAGWVLGRYGADEFMRRMERWREL